MFILTCIWHNFKGVYDLRESLLYNTVYRNILVFTVNELTVGV